MDESVNNKKTYGVCNPSFCGVLDYSYINTTIMTPFNSDDLNTVKSECLSYSNQSSNDASKTQIITVSKPNARSSSDPSWQNLTPLMYNMTLDDCESNKASNVDSHLQTKEKNQGFYGSISGIRQRETNPGKNRTSTSWPLSSFKATPKPSTFQSSFASNIKFSSRGLPNQSSNFTPTMYRRAISLRGHSSKKNQDFSKVLKSGSNGSLKLKGNVFLRRSNSEKGSCTMISKADEANGKPSQSPIPGNSFVRYGHPSENDPFGKGLLRDESSSISADDSFSTRSDDSHECFDIAELLKQSVCDSQYNIQSSEALSNDLKFLNKNLEEYVLSLSELLITYDKMKKISPDKIRQHFDLPLKLVGTMFNLQCEINKTLRNSCADLLTIARVFLNEQFVAYQQYMILSPSIYADFRHYKEHFEANFPTFKSLIMQPSSRLNFYVQTLNNLIQFASPQERRELEKSISYLEELKKNANTEMTIKIIKDSPIDLHLGGKILLVGELNYVSGPLSKKPYYVIAFKNLLVFTLSKFSYCIYVTHYRPEQIVSIGGHHENNLELTISKASSLQAYSEVHVFRITSSFVLEKWFNLIEEWISDHMASYEIMKDSNNYVSTYSNGKNFPLSLWQVFPFLKKLYFSESPGSTIVEGKNVNELCSLLVEKEQEYVEKLNNIFNPETLPPPPELKDLLQRILNLHELYFLPELKNTLKRGFQFVVNSFMNYLEKFNAYQAYIINRALCTTQMPDGMKAQYYVTPVQQFAFYIEWSRELGKNENFREASAYAVDTLLTYVTDAKVTLLHEAIPNCCLDFYRTGELKKGGHMDLRVRPRQKRLRDGSFLILLFEKVLLILKTISPTYYLVLDVWLYQVNFGPPSESPTGFKLEYRQGRNKSPITFEFKTQNFASKHDWMDQLSKVLQIQAEEIKKSSALVHCN